MTVPALLKRYACLCRVPLAFFICSSALTGFILASGGYLSTGALTGLSVFILSCGASALNQYQERGIDALMTRTRRRPLPSGDISPIHALAAALSLVAIGASLLLVAGGKTATLLGILAVLWYNGVYTYLKRITAFAAVPGALVGMLPPAIGWTTAGGVIADSRLLVTSVLFFLWQIPHFWLQILHHGEEYAKAGLPSLTEILSRRQIARMIFVWICAAVATSLMFPLYGAVTSPVVYYALVPAAFWIVLQGAHVMKADHSMGLSLLVFKHLNVYIMIVMVLLSSERVFSGRP